MPMIIYYAIAIAIFLISLAITWVIPTIPKEILVATKPVMQGASNMLELCGLAVIVAVIAFSVVAIIKSRKAEQK